MGEFLELSNRVSWHDAALGACFQLGLDETTIRCDLSVSDFPLIELINLVLYLNGSDWEVKNVRAIIIQPLLRTAGPLQFTPCRDPPHTWPMATATHIPLCFHEPVSGPPTAEICPRLPSPAPRSIPILSPEEPSTALPSPCPPLFAAHVSPPSAGKVTPPSAALLSPRSAVKFRPPSAALPCPPPLAAHASPPSAALLSLPAKSMASLPARVWQACRLRVWQACRLRVWQACRL